MSAAGISNLMSIDYLLASERGRRAEKERDAAVAELNDTRATDLDETRRLLYMALLRPKSDKWYDLGGTLINALAHHGLNIPAEESTPHLIALCGEDEAGDSEAWARALIERITGELGQ